MRKTYLIFEDDRTGGKLRTATKEEWKQIMDRNKENPSLRRYFIEDIIIDGWEVDRMYIETDKATYDQWRMKKEKEYRRRKKEAEYEKVQVLSLDDCVDWREEEIIDCTSDGIDWEEIMTDEFYIEDIRQTLHVMDGWALEMFDFLWNEYLEINSNKETALSRYANFVGITIKSASARRKKLINYLKKRKKIC